MSSKSWARVLAWTALCAASMLAANVQAADADKDKHRNDCLFTSQPQRWTVLDQQQLVVWGPSSKDAYLMKLFAPISDLRFTETLAFIDDDHNGMICSGGGDKLAVPNSRASSIPTPISSVRRVDDAELMALGEQYKVKLLSDKKIQELKQHDKQAHEN
jgi:hypothetical protein